MQMRKVKVLDENQIVRQRRRLHQLLLLSRFKNRANDSKGYLNPGLDLKKLHGLYVKWCTDQEIDSNNTARREQYRRHFKKFNIGFHQWRKDWCDIFSTLMSTGKVSTEEIEEQGKKEYARKIKEIHKCR